MADGVTLVTIITAPDSKPGTIAYSFSWRIPAELADAFTEEMTKRYGVPVEGLSTVKALVDRAKTNAEEGFLFTEREGTDGGDHG